MKEIYAQTAGSSAVLLAVAATVFLFSVTLVSRLIAKKMKTKTEKLFAAKGSPEEQALKSEVDFLSEIQGLLSFRSAVAAPGPFFIVAFVLCLGALLLHDKNMANLGVVTWVIADIAVILGSVRVVRTLRACSGSLSQSTPRERSRTLPGLRAQTASERPPRSFVERQCARTGNAKCQMPNVKSMTNDCNSLSRAECMSATACVRPTVKPCARPSTYSIPC